MKEQIYQEMKNLVTQHLPGLHAEALGDFIEKAQREEKELKEARVTIEKLEKVVKVKDGAIVELRSQIQREDKLDADEKKLKDSQVQLDFDGKLGELKIKCEKEKADLTVNLFDKVFRNTHIRRNRVGQVPVVNTWIDGNGQSQKSHGTELVDVDEIETKE